MLKVLDFEEADFGKRNGNTEVIHFDAAAGIRPKAGKEPYLAA